ncbi:hypothetical protein BH11ACT1_BH11ACT1_32170 [soil metagenome]
MRVRWIGLALALALVGAAAGYGIGLLSRDESDTFASAQPMPAQSPSVPIEPTATYSPYLDYPTLEPDLDYQTHRIGVPPYQWEYDAPKGWVVTQPDLNEMTWRPKDEPTLGGFLLRVKLINDHLTPAQMGEQKRLAVVGLYEDVDVTGQSGDQLSFYFREPVTQTRRYDLFKWFTSPGGTEADFEMSVAGREPDQVGLEDLLEHVAASVRRLP